MAAPVNHLFYSVGSSTMGFSAYRLEKVQFTRATIENTGKNITSVKLQNQQDTGVPHLKFCSILLYLILSRFPVLNEIKSKVQKHWGLFQPLFGMVFIQGDRQKPPFWK